MFSQSFCATETGMSSLMDHVACMQFSSTKYLYVKHNILALQFHAGCGCNTMGTDDLKYQL